MIGGEAKAEWGESGSPTWNNAAVLQVLMAYKSPELIFYSVKEPDRYMCPKRTHKYNDLYIHVSLCVCVCVCFKT